MRQLDAQRLYSWRSRSSSRSIRTLAVSFHDIEGSDVFWVKMRPSHLTANLPSDGLVRKPYSW